MSLLFGDMIECLFDKMLKAGEFDQGCRKMDLEV